MATTTICLDDGAAADSMMTTYDDIVQRYVFADAAGFTHCQLGEDGEACKYSQPGFNATSFLRHFRVAHPVLWKEIEQQKDNVDHGQGNMPMAWIPTTAVARQSPILSNGSSALLNNSTAKGTKRRLQTNEDVLDDDHEDESWIQTPSEDLAAYCRLCFSIVELQPVFADARDTNVSLTMLINSCTGIQLTPKTDFPCSICRECHSKLLEIQRFRRLCQTLNRVVRRTVTTSKHAIVQPPPPAPIIPVLACMESMPAPRSVTPVVTLIPNVSPPPPSSVIDLEDVVQEAYYVDGGEEDDDDDIICVSDETPTISNGPSAANAGDLEDDQPYTQLPDNWYCCRLCNRIYETLPTMMDHFRSNHKGSVRVLNVPKVNGTGYANYTAVVIGTDQYFKCNSCDSLFKSKSTLTRHWIRFHNGRGQKTDSKIPCPIGACDAFFMERTGFRRHLQLIHGYNTSRTETTMLTTMIAAATEKVVMATH